MRKTALIIAALALAACTRTESESAGEVVDTLNTPNLDVDLTKDTASLPTPDSLSDTLAAKKPVGRKPVEMKKLDTTRTPY